MWARMACKFRASMPKAFPLPAALLVLFLTLGWAAPARAERADRLQKIPGCTVLAKAEDPRLSGAFATVQFDGVDCGKLGDRLLSKYQIFTTPIVGPEVRGGPEKQFNGLRICPNVYTNPEEIDRFSAAVEESVPALRKSA